MNKFRIIAATLAIGIAPMLVTEAASAKAKPTPRCHAIVGKKKEWSSKFCPKKGKPGVNGKNGANGVNGANGLDGHPGKDGVQGANGKDGVAGQQGAQGQRGNDGSTGSAGRDGVSGYEVMTYDYIKGIGHREGFPGADAGYSGVGGGAPATVVCSSPNKVAVGGGYFIRDGASDRLDTNGAAMNANVIASFPGRVNWDTNSPRQGVYSGWIVRFGQSATPDNVTLYVICINAA